MVPDRVDGLILAKDAAAEGTVDSLKGRLGAGTRLKLIKGAAYADAAGPARLVIFVGGVETSTSTEADLDKALQLLTAGEESGVTDLHQVSSGPSDAVVKCGSIQTDSGPMAVCGWADRDSLGIGFFPHRSVAEAAPLLGQMHAAMRRQR